MWQNVSLVRFTARAAESAPPGHPVRVTAGRPGPYPEETR